MDPPIHALKFSEDLIFQILARHNATKDHEQWGFLRNLDMFQKQLCQLPVYEAVLGLMERWKERIQASFDELCSIKVFNINDFRLELSITAIMYFKEGYDHLKFLKYCALLGGLSVRYAKAGHREIPTGCTQLLGYLLNFWMYSMVFNPNSDYFELAVVAQQVRRKLMERMKDMPKKMSEEVKDTRKVSDEVKDTRKVSEEVKDTQKVAEKGEESLKMSKKGDEVPEKNGKEARKKTEKQKGVESAKAVHKVIDKAKCGKNAPKKKGSEKLPEKSDVVSEKMPGNDEMPKYNRPQKARRGGKK